MSPVPDTVPSTGGVPQTTRTSLSMVYGGGGAVGIAWHLAVIEALRQAGLDPSRAPSIGTSAGSWACGAAHLGFGIETFESFSDLDLPNRSPGFLADLARGIIGDARVAHARVAVVELPSMRHRLLSGGDHDLADLIAASSAVPALFAPHSIGSRRYVDGGVRSMAAAHAAHPADLLVASLPIAGHLFGAVGRSFEHAARRALSAWRSRHGGTTIVLRPGRRVARAVGSRPGNLMNAALALEIYPLALETVSSRLRRRLAELDERQELRDSRHSIGAQANLR